MGRKTKVPEERLFSVGLNYGWTGMSPSEMTEKFQRAAAKVDLLREEHKIDALAFTGSSGAAIAFVLSVALQIPLIYVRKKNEMSHGSPIEGNAWRGVRKYLIVDDFIDRGDTVRHIYESIRHAAKRERVAVPECVGIYLYSPAYRCRKHHFDDSTVPVFS